MFLLYLGCAFIGGYGIAQKINKNASILEHTAMGIGIGYLIIGWITYAASYVSKSIMNSSNPKLDGNAIAIAIMTLIAATTFRFEKEPEINIKKHLMFGMLFLSIFVSMFYVFRVDNGILKSGYTVFSDYAPHTAMIRSFSWHDNFPTQYSHYGGEDIKYHFMFQFLCGNLEYLGMRIDWAFNLTSAASLWGFLVMLYYYAKDITGKVSVGVISIVMFFFRSSFVVIEKFINALLSGTMTEFLHNCSFIGYTAHEDWGLWNYNVFLNQRHLGFGLLIAIIVIKYFSNYLNWLNNAKPGLKENVKTIFLTKDSWLPLNPAMSVILGLLLGGVAFWNGAVVIATLLILFGFAVASKNKLDYAITAVVTIVMSMSQTIFFMDSATTTYKGIHFLFGFIADEKTLTGALIYLIKLSGLFFIGVALFIFIFKGKRKALTASFLLPVIFAFSISMTPDITVNHKYIMISVIFLNIIWACFIVNLFNKNIICKAISILLIVLLTSTGLYDMITIYNADKSTLNIDTESHLTKWLKENVKENDIVLVNQDSMTEVSLSGVMMYNGWPYYAWSAGYDTDKRDAMVNKIYSEKNPEKLRILLKNEHIKYIVIDEFDERDSSTIKDNLECVYKNDTNSVYMVN